MKFLADLHIHSHYSRATSKNLDLEHLTQWAQFKGIHVVGTGDIAHPGWLQEMEKKLEPAEEGLFRLKAEYAQAVQEDVFAACQHAVRFMLAGEISSIYKKNDKVRKIHNIIFAPTFEAVAKIQSALEKIGNIRSDGRPILGLDSRDLLEIILNIDPQCYLIPAHIWTPWFSLLGSKSGFDSVEECFEDLTPHIFALETGLSSDPAMNWRISALDRYTLISNSDAHSPPKLAREANLFQTELSYPAIFEALKSGNPATFLGTIEFFPQEGKYHHDGHRKCDINWDPKTTLAHQGLCPQCGKAVTVGVMHRVETLADRAEIEKPAHRPPFDSLIPLPEILGEIYQVGPKSKRVQRQYETLLTELGSELTILLKTPLDDIKQHGGSLLAEGIRRMRNGQVVATAGYDGEFGIIKLFEPHDREIFSPQLNFLPARSSTTRQQKKLSQPPPQPKIDQNKPKKPTQPKTQQEVAEQPKVNQPTPKFIAENPNSLLAGLNRQQKEAVLSINAPLIIVAGPGTGKTHTLTHRMAYLVTAKDVPPQQILAVTFTHKAAEEMVTRLQDLLGDGPTRHTTVKTFHAFASIILRQAGQFMGLAPNFSICSEQDRHFLLKQCYPDFGDKEIKQYLEAISAAKNSLITPKLWSDKSQQALLEIYQSYELALQQNQLLDFDDLILKTVTLFENFPELLRNYQTQYRWISVDEYQDLNLAQYQLLRLLVTPDSNLCVIGDPDQAIYAFRGANPAYFLRFGEDFPEAKSIHLSQNYRSTQKILAASGQVIAENIDHDRGALWSNFVDKTLLDVYQAPTDKAEAEYIVHQIEKMIGGTSYFSLNSGRVEDDSISTLAFADFAVLYRVKAQTPLLIEAFDRSGMPYQSAGQTPFYARKSIREILAYLCLTHNPNSIFYLGRILNVRSVIFSPAHLEKLTPYTIEQGLSKGMLSSELLQALTARQKKSLQTVIPFLTELQTLKQTEAVTTLIEHINQFMLDNKIVASSEARDEEIQRLISRADPFAHRMSDFLEAAILHKETDEYDPRADRVALMTLHAAKGLEFPVVFIVGCEETLLPYQRKGQDFDLEEERRLFYVGMTRAQKKLILTHTKSRFLFGQQQQNERSAFVADIEQPLLELKKATPRRSVEEKDDITQLKLF